MENIIKVTIEIPKNSNIKYEYNRKKKCIEVDRILRDGFRYPANYGFIPNTLDWDGDELDVLVYSEEQFIPGVALNARIIGAMKMIDSGEIDTKLITVHQDDYRLSEINNLNDLPNEFLKKVEDFFTNYKNWKKPNLVQITGFEDIKWALSEYKECKQLMAKYGELDKKNFIDKMKTLYPEKYKE